MYIVSLTESLNILISYYESRYLMKMKSSFFSNSQ